MQSPSKRKIVIPGGAGYLGQAFAAHFAAQGDQVYILSRRAQPDAGNIHYLAWDGATLGPWASVFDGADAVINMAGRTVNCRYNARNKRQIYDSRLRSTRVIGQAIATCARPPRVWLNASSATIYRDADDREVDEASGEIGSGFSVDVCQKWEFELWNSPTPHTRKVALRMAVVFGRGKGGPAEAFANIVRLGLGGTQGNGRQYVSWIHMADCIRSLEWLLAHEALSGPVNLAAPNPLPNREFMRTFRQMCRQPIGLPANRLMLEVGAFFLRTETELLLKSRRVVPGRLRESGFSFAYPTFAEALHEILH
ncbi:MAG: TIGR01777 family oxidoreductase [Chloroflexaceae bacterium]|jgi:hypothetical protein|nr:TIGR01777 family oxidoreductase [Chloroflexaceae bacterium]